MLIGIAGKAGAGKDTAALWFQGNYGYRVMGLSWAMEDMLNPVLLRYMRQDKIKWNDREWKEAIIPGLGVSPRQLKQKLGTEWRDEISPDKMLWCNLLEIDMKSNYNGIKKSVVPDIRFPHEQDWVHSNGGIIIYIHRQGVEEVAAHSSENSIDKTKIDFNIFNTGTIEDMYEDLKRSWEYITKSCQLNYPIKKYVISR